MEEGKKGLSDSNLFSSEPVTRADTETKGAYEADLKRDDVDWLQEFSAHTVESAPDLADSTAPFNITLDDTILDSINAVPKDVSRGVSRVPITQDKHIPIVDDFNLGDMAGYKEYVKPVDVESVPKGTPEIEDTWFNGAEKGIKGMAANGRVFDEDVVVPIEMPPEENGDVVDEIVDKALGFGKTAARIGKKALTLGLSLYQDNAIHKKFEKGSLVDSGDFLFLRYNNELMAYKYKGVSMNVVIPDSVGNLPVRYVYQGFLSKGVFNNHKVRSFLSYFKEENVANMTVDALKDCATGIKSIQLPAELDMLPQNAFNNCYKLERIEIPASVRMVSPAAFNNCKLREIFFTGSCPKNLDQVKFDLGTNLHVIKEFADSYRKVIKNCNMRAAHLGYVKEVV